MGNVVGRFLDRTGQVVAHRLNDSTIGIELEMLCRTPERILAAAGPHKVAIIRAVLQAGLATVLVPDDLTAHLLLDKAWTIPSPAVP